mmetsp:Transcript_22545/g.46783  ORF Transcript_22545/g.46783 Transcript_22545/m.46783 type:complete len:103 (+) Transcript_22545:217-525(+)
MAKAPGTVISILPTPPSLLSVLSTSMSPASLPSSSSSGSQQALNDETVKYNWNNQGRTVRTCIMINECRPKKTNEMICMYTFSLDHDKTNIHVPTLQLPGSL